MKKIVYGLFVILGALWVTACSQNEMELDKGSEMLALSANQESLILDQLLDNRDALQYSWSSGTNNGSGAAISYTFELGIAGKKFVGGVKRELGKTDSRIIKYTHQELNDLLLSWNVPVETSVNLEARITANVSTPSVPTQVSNILTLKVKTYKFRFLNLYMLGDASPNGWANDRATPMIGVAGESGGFEWSGLLNRGELKFIPRLGIFNPSFVCEREDGTGSRLVYREGSNVPDYKFKINSTGMYKVKLNVETLTISITNIDEPQPYDDLWISGNSVGGNPVKMTRDAVDRYLFTYSGRMTSGKIQIATNSQAADCAKFQPVIDGASIMSSALEKVEQGTPASKSWNIAVENKYTIKIDLRSKRMQASQFVPFAKMWMIGDATPGGWSWDDVTPMVQSADNPNIFEYSGALKAGEIKFPLEVKHDWSGKFIIATKNGANIETDHGYMVGNQPDNKWRITGAQAGVYLIRIDLYNEAITFTKK